MSLITDKDTAYINSLEFMRTLAGRNILRLASLSHTVIGVVATNARLSKEEANKVGFGLDNIRCYPG